MFNFINNLKKVVFIGGGGGAGKSTSLQQLIKNQLIVGTTARKGPFSVFWKKLMLA